MHGGALVTGGSSSIMYDLEHLAKKVVVVSINYRLGLWDFLDLMKPQMAKLIHQVMKV